MSRDSRGPRGPLRPRDADELPAATRLALRSVYAPPGDEAYWDGLEARVLARVRAARAGDDWSHVLVGWARLGIAAAAAAAVVAGLALAQVRREAARQQERAFAAVMDDVSSVPAVAATGPDESRAREATLRYLITH
ncbi:MAG: hypothetical protein ACJ8AO_04945 [Gemmatimonadaceae bacterium]